MIDIGVGIIITALVVGVIFIILTMCVSAGFTRLVETVKTVIRSRLL